MEDIKVNFGKRVKQLRVSNGYSQEKLAEISDLDRTYIPGIEAGKRNVSKEIINKLAKEFEIEIHKLFE
ncbi:helix-turn-helix domain-containing protein [Yeosuana sp.]|uniref:helix-turn-helix domain-containing protein n=1 Tax=Yeosuana sp. TaxID=2529388 RepID=UPI004054B252